MPDDLYDILGVAKTATDKEIRKAYRDLAKKLHPDLNPGDAAAEERFKKVSAAYDILGDSELRRRYDKGEIDASGAERPERQFYRHYAEGTGGERYHRSAGFEDIGGFSDLFSDLFGRHGGAGGIRIRGQDRRYHLDIDFLDAAYGTSRRVTMPDGSTLDVTIPPGLRDGATLRLRGKGDPGLGGAPAGDALVDVTVRPHHRFKREGDDVVVELPISLDEAVLGGKIRVETLSGSVDMAIPKGVSSGATLRLKGKGIKPKDRPAGDQLVRLKIVMPDKIDADLAEFMDDWRKRHGYDPRATSRRAS